jgi:hypothetical protein
MFIRKQALEEGAVRNMVGGQDSQTGKDFYTQQDPVGNKANRIVARVEVSCDENENGLTTARGLLEELLSNVDARIAAKNYTP